MKILIIAPEIHRLGGVANHYLGLSSHWTFDVRYLFYGKRKDTTPVWLALLFYPYDYLRYIFILLFKSVDVVVVNPSLRKAQLIRDGLFLLISKLFGKKVITFMHGFDSSYCEKLGRSNIRLFQWCFNKSTFMYALYSGFKKELEEAGINIPILLTTTKVANELISGIEIEPVKEIHSLLYVARVNQEKGIFTTLQTYELLKKKHPNLSLVICGDGPSLSASKKYVKEHGIFDVIFKGNVTGVELRDAYLKGDLYILPTTHGEGMATTVLEAMAFGLPVVTRPNGGVKDFWTENMGFLINSTDPNDYADAIDSLILDKNKTEYISIFNMQYAKEHFMADRVTAKFESDILRYTT